MALGWILASCFLLSLYDLSKKASVRENAVFPVLLGSTLSGFAAVTAVLAARGDLVAALRVPPGVVGLLLIKSCIVGASWTATYMALRTLAITTAAPIRATGPLWTFLGAVILFGEIPTSRQALGMALAFLGCLAFVVIPRTTNTETRDARPESRTTLPLPLLLAFIGTFFGSASALYDKCLLQQRGLATGTVLWWFLGGMCLIYGAAVILGRRAASRPAFHFRWTIPLVGILLAASDACYFNAVSTPEAKISILSLVRRSSVVLTFLIGGAVFRETHLVRKGLALTAILLGVILLCATARGDVLLPTNWTGTVRTDDGWFAYRLDAATDGAPRLTDEHTFILSPRAESPLRHVAIRVRNGAFTLAPLVAGREQSPRRDWTHLGTVGDETILSLSFTETDGVDAIRLWGSGDLLAIDLSDTTEVAPDLLALPSVPTLTVTSLAADAIALATALPANASGARFRLSRLEGVPRATLREDFTNGNASWEIECANAQFGAYTSATMTDTKTANDGASLRLAKGDDDGEVTAYVLSPTVPAPITEYSFVTKRTSGDSSDRVSVYGLAADTTAWTRLDAGWTVETTMRWITNAVDSARGITRLKFVFSADAATCRPALLDTLRIVYGGNETRVDTAEPLSADGTFATNGLATARYAVAAQVLGADGTPSRWSAETIVDLAWANLAALAPANLTASCDASGIALSWAAVEGAVRYRVTVKSADGTLLLNRLTDDAVATLTEITQAGSYQATVASVLPDGRESDPSAPVTITAAVGAVEKLSLTAKGGERLTATWSAATFATAYRVTVVAVDDEERIVRTLTTRETSITVAGLSSAGTYRVKVEAVDGPEGTWSEPVAMAATAPRRGRAVSLKDVFAAGGTYQQDFTLFATTNYDLAYAQFFVGGVPARETRRTSVGKSTSAGVFAIAEASGAMYLASRANSTSDVRLGLAFANDTSRRVEVQSLAFDALFPDGANTKAYVVETLVTDGETSLDADGEWQPVADDGAMTGTILAPSQAFIVRWRDDAKTSSPVLGLDNVSLVFEKLGDVGLHVILR